MACKKINNYIEIKKKMSFFYSEENTVPAAKGNSTHAPDRFFGVKPAQKTRQCNPNKHQSSVFESNSGD